MVLGGHAIAACGNLCDYEWLDMATPTELKAELDTGADVMSRDEDGGTPLHAAVQTDNPEITKIFLNAGANVNARSSSGHTPLHDAAKCFICTTGAIEALLEAGGDPRATTKFNDTPWDCAKKNETLKRHYKLLGAK